MMTLVLYDRCATRAIHNSPTSYLGEIRLLDVVLNHPPYNRRDQWFVVSSLCLRAYKRCVARCCKMLSLPGLPFFWHLQVSSLLSAALCFVHAILDGIPADDLCCFGPKPFFLQNDPSALLLDEDALLGRIPRCAFFASLSAT